MTTVQKVILGVLIFVLAIWLYANYKAKKQNDCYVIKKEATIYPYWNSGEFNVIPIWAGQQKTFKVGDCVKAEVRGNALLHETLQGNYNIKDLI